MREFEYVSRKEAAPHKENLINLIKAVQKELNPYFTFRFDFIGSSSRNMITREVNGNIGYDFDLNIEPNDPEENNLCPLDEWTLDSFPFNKCCEEIRVNVNGGAFFLQPGLQR